MITVRNLSKFRTYWVLLGSILFIALDIVTSVHAYEMPIGIPEPFVNPDIQKPQRPANWDHEIPGYYYVDYENGTDSGLTYGYPDSPRRTLPNPIPAGSYIEVNGNYEHVKGGVIWIKGNGTGDDWQANTSGPVWIVSKNSDSRAFFTSDKTILYGSYVYIDNVKFDRLQIGSPTSGQPGADHILVRNCEMEGDGLSRWNGLPIIGNDAGILSNIVIYKNLIHNYGDINSSKDQDAGGIFVGHHSNYVWVLNNVVHTCSGSGIFVGGQANTDPSLCHHVFVGGNEAYNVRQSGVWLKEGQDIVFSSNYVHDIINTSWSPSKGFGAQYGPIRLWIIYNRVERIRYGIRISATDSDKDCTIHIIGNTISEMHNINGEYDGGSYREAGIQIGGGDHINIINNTIHNCDAGINLSKSAEYNIENNIINKITEPNGNHIYVENGVNNSYISNCIFYQPEGDVRIKWGSGSPKTLAVIQSEEPNRFKNNLSVDPLFITSDAAFLHLAQGSPAVDRGLSPENLKFDVYGDYTVRFGVDIRSDIDGQLRPSGNGWDIGADELSELGSTSQAPQNLRVVTD